MTYLCGVKKEAILQVFEQLRQALIAVNEQEEWPGYACGLTREEFEKFRGMMGREMVHNPWFTLSNVQSALKGIAFLLEPKRLTAFADNYTFRENPKRVAIVMAGNIPLVGFHDLLCVLVTGNTAICKLSSGDNRLLQQVILWLYEWNPELKQRIEISFGPLKHYDAVIATGSDNTINQFENYFRTVPHLFRRNRTSVALLEGSESNEELAALASDCFLYFGMGCRNVSKILVPENFDLNRIFENFLSISEIIQHHKYGNNYDYNRTVYLMNQIPFLDNNVFLLKEDEGLHAPLSVIYFQRYNDISEVNAFLDQYEEQIQVVVGKDRIPFGKAQNPEIDDFADNIDTCNWLNSI